ncbi:tyrosine-type recombinase/integrase [Pasteurella atlantica]|uniref:Tyrosine-type recombinase/integrase n=2 Tax=Pasteurellaceae TaxID=712 RepID=A0ACC6HNL7_9PAST|nr:tyrosine-type recombinase/integrase [Pasteurella atlantica]MDP8052467.1 tyrosine-type recombinase/integrase [Pasteurella atlantica]MDP8105746.1 tyrosine-type recombinase/integrase [Pasteurella atlantica]MDP8149178.1 tyrosine-type recombinase/integrase [Pasteurella atlantica]
MKLTNLQIKNETFNNKNRKLFDGQGLYLHITKSGKYWRYKYNYANREKLLSLGVYPEVSLKMARELHFEARALLRKGLCPCTEKQKYKKQITVEFNNTFEKIAKEWYEFKRPDWSNPKHAQQVINTLTDYTFPFIGKYPITEITPVQVMNILNKIKDKAETCKRLKQRISAVFDYAVYTGRLSSNPVQSLPNPAKGKKVKNHLSLPADEIPEFYKKLRTYHCQQAQLGLRLIILTFVRSSELRKAQWSEFKGNEWHIPAERMKKRLPHIVPLSDWALETLEELKELNSKEANKSTLLFPSKLSPQKPVNENIFIKAMQQIGYKDKAVPHGFRAMASSILNESELFSPDVIERQLAHSERNKVRAAYNRAEYMEKRHEMMQWYSDFLKKHW